MSSIPPKVLLAEDDRFISRAYEDGLTRAGFQMVMAHDGIEAVSKITSEKPDIIFLDVIMPGKNGFEVLEEIKKDKKLKKIPVIMLSNLGQDSDIKQAKDMGALGYLIKSNTSMKDVIAKVHEVLG